MLFLFTVCSLVVSFVKNINSVPPDACFAKFRWEDCGKPPTHVMYYWKSGSRCEVGIWRGCLPNHNMFKDEYECVATCIFAPRARPEDYHNYNDVDYNDKYDKTDEDSDMATTYDPGNDTMETATAKDGETKEEDTTAEPSADGDSTSADANAATAGGDADATTAGGDAGADGDAATAADAEGGDAVTKGEDAPE